MRKRRPGRARHQGGVRLEQYVGASETRPGAGTLVLSIFPFFSSLALGQWSFHISKGHKEDSMLPILSLQPGVPTALVPHQPLRQSLRRKSREANQGTHPHSFSTSCSKKGVSMFSSPQTRGSTARQFTV